MRVSSALSLTAVVICAAVGFAGPAHAEDFSGTYIRTSPGERSTWVVTLCGQDCIHVADSTGWSADAHPFGDVWRFVVDLPYGTKCNNDGTTPGTVTFKVDASGREGTFENSRPGPCQLAPGWSHPVYFTLTKL